MLSLWNTADAAMAASDSLEAVRSSRIAAPLKDPAILLAKALRVAPRHAKVREGFLIGRYHRLSEKALIDRYQDWFLMAVLDVPFHSPWFFSRWAFAILLVRSMERVEGNLDDAYELRQAIALDGLHFELLEPAMGARLAQVVGAAAAELHEEFRVKEDADQRDREFADLLEEVALVLQANEWDPRED